MTTENPKPRVGDTDTVVRLNMQEDVTGATTLSIKYMKPDMTTVGEADGAAYQTNSIQATLPELDQEGDWVLVPYAVNLSGWTGHGDPIYMHVYGIYEVVSV